MGFFKHLTNRSATVKVKPKIEINNDIEIADALFSSLNIGVGIEISKEAQKILATCNSRQDVLDRIIELASKHDTPRSRKLLALSYAWKGATYRKEAIEALNNYINNELDESEFRNMFIPGTTIFASISEEAKNRHLSDMYNFLGKCYEGEYEFDKALETFQKSHELAPEYIHNVLNVARVYSKLNDIDKSIEMLEQYKRTTWYLNDESNREVTNNYLSEYKGKKERGYVYRPRKRKEI
ncbi:MAG: tetratricopeptide repeat protein [Thomasclavelia sp.]|jgi:tetratricopeptide (TPR) repeat protein|nr:tetratricopeptide repeat protein [Thomasclavelia sp.]